MFCLTGVCGGVKLLVRSGFAAFFNWMCVDWWWRRLKNHWPLCVHYLLFLCSIILYTTLSLLSHCGCGCGCGDFGLSAVSTGFGGGCGVFSVPYGGSGTIIKFAPVVRNTAAASEKSTATAVGLYSQW